MSNTNSPINRSSTPPEMLKTKSFQSASAATSEEHTSTKRGSVESNQKITSSRESSEDKKKIELLEKQLREMAKHQDQLQHQLQQQQRPRMWTTVSPATSEASHSRSGSDRDKTGMAMQHEKMDTSDRQSTCGGGGGGANPTLVSSQPYGGAHESLRSRSTSSGSVPTPSSGVVGGKLPTQEAASESHPLSTATPPLPPAATALPSQQHSASQQLVFFNMPVDQMSRSDGINAQSPYSSGGYVDLPPSSSAGSSQRRWATGESSPTQQPQQRASSGRNRVGMIQQQTIPPSRSSSWSSSGIPAAVVNGIAGNGAGGGVGNLVLVAPEYYHQLQHYHQQTSSQQQLQQLPKPSQNTVGVQPTPLPPLTYAEGDAFSPTTSDVCVPLYPVTLQDGQGVMYVTTNSHAGAPPPGEGSVGVGSRTFSDFGALLSNNASRHSLKNSQQTESTPDDSRHVAAHSQLFVTTTSNNTRRSSTSEDNHNNASGSGGNPSAAGAGLPVFRSINPVSSFSGNSPSSTYGKMVFSINSNSNSARVVQPIPAMQDPSHHRSDGVRPSFDLDESLPPETSQTQLRGSSGTQPMPQPQQIPLRRNTVGSNDPVPKPQSAMSKQHRRSVAFVPQDYQHTSKLSCKFDVVGQNTRHSATICTDVLSEGHTTPSTSSGHSSQHKEDSGDVTDPNSAAGAPKSILRPHSRSPGTEALQGVQPSMKEVHRPPPLEGAPQAPATQLASSHNNPRSRRRRMSSQQEIRRQQQLSSAASWMARLVRSPTNSQMSSFNIAAGSPGLMRNPTSFRDQQGDGGFDSDASSLNFPSASMRHPHHEEGRMVTASNHQRQQPPDGVGYHTNTTDGKLLSATSEADGTMSLKSEEEMVEHSKRDLPFLPSRAGGRHSLGEGHLHELALPHRQAASGVPPSNTSISAEENSNGDPSKSKIDLSITAQFREGSADPNGLFADSFERSMSVNVTSEYMEKVIDLAQASTNWSTTEGTGTYSSESVAATLCDIIYIVFSAVLMFLSLAAIAHVNSDPFPTDTLIISIVGSVYTIFFAVIHSKTRVRISEWEVVDDPSVLLKRYLCSIWSAVDFFSIAPFELIFIGWNAVGFAVAINRHLLRIPRIFSLRKSTHPLIASRRWFTIAVICVIAVIMCEVFALLFIELEHTHGSEQPQRTGLTATTIDASNNENERMSHMDAVYWTVTTMTSVGYGDIIPTSRETKFVAVALQILGVLTVAAITSVGTKFLTRTDAVKEDLERQKNELYSMLRFYNVPWEVQKEVMAVYPSVLAKASELKFQAIISTMPGGVGERLDVFLRQKLLSRIPLFAEMDTGIITELAFALSPLRLQAGDSIMTAGEYGYELYLISSGCVDVIETFGTGDMQLREIVGVLGAGQWFGEVALVQETIRRVSAEASTACELLVLHRDDVRVIARRHKKLAVALNLEAGDLHRSMSVSGLMETGDNPFLATSRRRNVWGDEGDQYPSNFEDDVGALTDQQLAAPVVVEINPPSESNSGLQSGTSTNNPDMHEQRLSSSDPNRQKKPDGEDNGSEEEHRKNTREFSGTSTQEEAGAFSAVMVN